MSVRRLGSVGNKKSIEHHIIHFLHPSLNLCRPQRKVPWGSMQMKAQNIQGESCCDLCLHDIIKSILIYLKIILTHLQQRTLGEGPTATSSVLKSSLNSVTWSSDKLTFDLDLIDNLDPILSKPFILNFSVC